MAALIDYCGQGNDHDARPLSFRLEHIGREVDAGFYSRKREIDRESSFSVLGQASRIDLPRPRDVWDTGRATRSRIVATWIGWPQ